MGKKNLAVTLICTAALCLTSCGEKAQTKSDTQLVEKDSVVITAPQRMQVSEVHTNIDFRGKQYHSSVVRRPDETLPMVTNEQGDKFIDNRITVRLLQGDRKVLDRTFTKADFASVVDEKFMKYAILEGLVFDQTSNEGIRYAASVCYPQTDLYVPIRILVSADGKLTISHEELLDE